MHITITLDCRGKRKKRTRNVPESHYFTEQRIGAWLAGNYVSGSIVLSLLLYLCIDCFCVLCAARDPGDWQSEKRQAEQPRNWKTSGASAPFVTGDGAWLNHKQDLPAGTQWSCWCPTMWAGAVAGRKGRGVSCELPSLLLETKKPAPGF